MMKGDNMSDADNALDCEKKDESTSQRDLFMMKRDLYIMKSDNIEIEKSLYQEEMCISWKET